MNTFLWILLFLIAGFISEILICFYHRSRETNKIWQASFYSALITAIMTMVSTRIVFSVTASSLGHWSLLFIGFFAIGKGMGTYTGLKLWDRIYKGPAAIP